MSLDLAPIRGDLRQNTHGDWNGIFSRPWIRWFITLDDHVKTADLDFAGDTGTGAVIIESQTFTLSGTTNEIDTAASGTTITIGLPDDVVIGGDLTVTVDFSVGGIANIIGDATFFSDLDVGGDLDVTGTISGTIGTLVTGSIVNVNYDERVPTYTAGLLTQIVYKLSSATVETVNFTYDSSNRPATATAVTGGGVWTYTHSGTGFLTGAVKT